MILIPVYDTIILPESRVHFPKKAWEEMELGEIHANDRIVFLMKREESDAAEFYPIGVSGMVTEIDQDGSVSIETDGRLNIEDIAPNGQNVIAVARPEQKDLPEEEIRSHFEEIRKSILRYVQKYQWGLVARGYILQWKTLNEMAVGLSPFFNLSSEEKYAILAADTASQRVELIEKAVMDFMAVSDVTQEAEQAQKSKNEALYREDAIKKQISYLQKQLDDMHPENISDVRKFEQKLDELGMNETARREADKVLNRMKQEGQDGHEYGMLYDYLDFVTSLHWKAEPARSVDLQKAQEILDQEHYGLKKVKRRILEQLAVMGLKKQQSGSILLFVGPPGTGKTSIGHSIAQALGREYVRVSLGGVRDEAEIRGHRRTYIGAMPGRIMEGIKNSGVSNPVMVLDEVDKLARDYAGDPASALLEVLDPEQNANFTDHYMNVPYDLSNVLFICTANSVDTIPAPLLDRMEVIRFSGYTPVEKFHIAKEHLFPRAKEKMGIDDQQLKLTDGALRALISQYTMEAGVRGLKKTLDTLCRAGAVKLLSGEAEKLSVNEKMLPELLDRHPMHHDRVLTNKEPGIVTGLAWTAAGGEILFIEAMMTKGKGQLLITGQLGDVMKESAQIAVTLVKKLYPEQAELFEKNDLHIHVPEGAVPKDGPSAGVTLTTALASLVTGKAVNPALAMTGEVSLRGNVMPIGGLPEKLMAAQRAGVKKVLIPHENEEDLKDVAPEVLEKLEIIPVRKVSEVLKAALG